MTSTTFESLNLSPELNKALTRMGFETPSPIQTAAIPVMMEGRDIIGQAQTGTGKTAAFAIPIIEKVDASRRDVQAVVLCPTRELAMQVAEEFRKLLKYKEGISLVCVYGGEPIFRQQLALQNEPQIIIGTPGRMMDHLWQGTFHFNAVQTVVLDEADEMLDLGFRDDIEKIFDFIPTPRQTVLFSATMPPPILELTKRYQQDPEWIRVQPQSSEAALIDQYYVEVTPRTRLGELTRLLDEHQVKLALVFCNSKRLVDELTKQLKAKGYLVEGLHGGMAQGLRTSIMGRFRRGAIHILVATDVAARGIDVRNVEIVFNYDLPRDTEGYIHRIGRTGRAGKTGRAYTLVLTSQMNQLKMLEVALKIPLQSKPAMIGPVETVATGKPGIEPKIKPRRNNRRPRRKPNALPQSAIDQAKKPS